MTIRASNHLPLLVGVAVAGLLTAAVVLSSRPPDPTPGLLRRLVAATTDSELRLVWRDARAAGLHDLARLAAEAALRRDETLAWANEAVGNRDLRDLISRLDARVEQVPDLDTYPDPAYRELREIEDRSDWVTPQEYDRAARLLAETGAHADRLASDPWYLDLARVRVWVRVHPVFHAMETEVLGRAPYAVAFERTGADGGARARADAERDADLLDHLRREFLRIFGKAVDLPDIAKEKRPDVRVLKVFLFASEESFRRYQAAIGQPLPSGVGAYYSPRDQWLLLFEGEPAEADGSGFREQRLLHEGTHQLIHAMTKVLVSRERGEEVLWTDPVLLNRCHWFQEGLPELIASSKPGADGKPELMALNRYRAQAWWTTRHPKGVDWELGELLRIPDSRQLRLAAAQKGLAQADRLSSLFYSQAWAFCHFLWYFEDGKYRDRFLAYVDRELHGRSGYEEWMKAFGKTDDDWSAIDAEWRRHFEALCGELEIR